MYLCVDLELQDHNTIASNYFFEIEYIVNSGLTTVMEGQKLHSQY
jgi:hypothetical protein